MFEITQISFLIRTHYYIIKKKSMYIILAHFSCVLYYIIYFISWFFLNATHTTHELFNLNLSIIQWMNDDTFLGVYELGPLVFELHLLKIFNNSLNICPTRLMSKVYTFFFIYLGIFTQINKLFENVNFIK